VSDTDALIRWMRPEKSIVHWRRLHEIKTILFRKKIGFEGVAIN